MSIAPDIMPREAAPPSVRELALALIVKRALLLIVAGINQWYGFDKSHQ